MSKMVLLKNLDAAELTAAIVHHVLKKQGITYSGPLAIDFQSLDAKSGLTAPLRVELVLDTDYIAK